MGISMSTKSGHLPVGWIKILDKPSGKYFFVNLKTKRRQWNDPREYGPRHIRDYMGEIRALPTGWYIAYDPETKRDYYFNTYTNHSQWHFPSEQQSGASSSNSSSSSSKQQSETSKLEAQLANVRVTLSSDSLSSNNQNNENDQIKAEITRRKCQSVCRKTTNSNDH